jgi:hypothetical protein
MNKKFLISQLAGKVLQDQMLMQKLSNLVYELMLEDFRNQRNCYSKYRR